MRFHLFVACAALLARALCGPAAAATIAIVHGTLIDVANFGHSANDIPDATVIVRNGKIESAGRAKSIWVPRSAHIIDAHGRFLVPGLIDGFGAMRTQGFANAYLYNGVTSVYVPEAGAVGDGEDSHRVLTGADPSPRQFLGAVMTGYSAQGEDYAGHPMTEHRLHDPRLSNEALAERLYALAAKGFRGVTISYDTWPDQADIIIRIARTLRMATLGELAFTSYPYAVRAGVGALVHNDRYLTELATTAHRLDYSDDPQSGDGARLAYHDVCVADPQSGAVSEYGARLAQSNTALLPLLSIEATADSLDVPNPWSARSAALISPDDLDSPVDKASGESAFLATAPPDGRASLQECARHREFLDKRLHELGARYLAGSGAPAYGIMPGSGLHTELSLLQRIGLSPREALAAATGNFADVYGWRDVGRIEAGRNADILVLDSDPRLGAAALDHISTLIFDGKVVDRESLLKSAH
jgi:hypothetical protein